MTTEDYKQIVPLKWYKFIIYFQLFAGGILDFANAFGYFTGNNYGEESEMVYATYGWLYLLDKVWGCVLVITGVFCFKVRQDLANFRVEGPSRYLYLAGINFFGSFIYTICFIMITDTSMDSLLLIRPFIYILVGIVFICLNKAYFDNRKFLFTETKSTINKSQEYDTETETNDSTTQEVAESEKQSNKFLDTLDAQKEKVKRQNTVTNEKLTQNEKPEEKIFCANCSKDLTYDIESAPGLMFCPYCDTPICLQSNKWTCTHCGQENLITAKFCKSCGTWRFAANEQKKGKEQSSNMKEKGQNSNTEELKLLKTKKAINGHKDLYVITSIILYVLAFFTASIPNATFILALSTPFISHAIVNIKLKKSTSESKMQICYYMSFVWKFYTVIFALLFLVATIFMILSDTSKWMIALIVFIPAWIVFSLPNFLDSRWWKHQYRVTISKSRQNQQNGERPISIETNIRSLDAFNSQREKVKQQNNNETDTVIADTETAMDSDKTQAVERNCQIVLEKSENTIDKQSKENDYNSYTEYSTIQTAHQTKKCIKCNYELKNDAKFCIICGEKQPK